MVENDTTGFDESEFNISMSTLQWINFLMNKYDESMFEGQLEKAFETLCIIHDKLEFSFKEKERKFINEREREAEKYLEKLSGSVDEIYIIEGRSFFKRVKERKSFRKMLRIFSRVLRRLMNEKGMLMKQKDDSDLF